MLESFVFLIKLGGMRIPVYVYIYEMLIVYKIKYIFFE